MKKKAGGIGTAVFFLFLILVMARNDDGDWFTPNRRVVPVTVPAPADIWNSSQFIGDSEQVLVVATASTGSSSGTAALFEKTDSGWKRVYDKMPAILGKNGLTSNRSEGDGSTPTGSHRIGIALGSAKKIDTDLRYSQITPGSCWISTPGTEYNRWTTRSSCVQPNVDLYKLRETSFEHAAVIDFNPGNLAGKGSALFLFQKVDGISSTSGSVALARGDLVKVLSRLSTDLRPRIIIGSAEWLTGTASAGANSGWSTLRQGSTGEQVRQLQYALTAAGYPTKVDGTFAEETDTNVREFQAARKLKVDGVVGTETARALGLIA